MIEMQGDRQVMILTKYILGYWLTLDIKRTRLSDTAAGQFASARGGQIQPAHTGQGNRRLQLTVSS
jgi:hypothetical protein